MAVVVAWIGEMLLSIAGQLILSALVSLGIGFAASKLVSGVIDPIGIKSMLGNAGVLLDYLGWLGVDQAITIVLSAWAGRKITDAARIHFISKRTTS